MKKYILGLVVLTTLLFSSSHASKLPDDVWKYMKISLPEVQQRFDSVLTLPDGVMYIPLYPPADITVEEIKTDYTYPESASISSYPEVILLNNGYSFLKVSKDADGNYTLTKKDDLPIKVRLGIMPQDMLMPVGLKLPESLRLTLGDLLIPSKEETSLAYKDDEGSEQKASDSSNNKRNEFIPAVEFKNKKVLLNPKNSKFVQVYDSTNPAPLYELKLSSMPLKIITSDKSEVALVLYWSGKTADIISLRDENVVAQIQLEGRASDVVLNEKENLAYITSQNAGAIYVVDLNTMHLIKIIKVDQRPSKITYCSEDDTISFFDEYAQQIYNVTRNESEYVVQAMGNANSVSKVLSDIANIYAISRTKSELYVFDKVHGELLATVPLDIKPTDAIIYDTKLFVLCAQEGYLDVYDTVNGKLIAREKLQKKDKTGFYSKITYIPKDKTILITGINANSYILYDLEQMKTVRTQESYVDVANIMIFDKMQETKSNESSL